MQKPPSWKDHQSIDHSGRTFAIRAVTASGIRIYGRDSHRIARAYDRHQSSQCPHCSKREETIQ